MNLKKIAASIAALGAVTFAHAANVEFYGSIDNSVSYIKAKGQNGQASMYASNDSSPKLGLTGKEDIGNGHFVRFKLENGFNADDGSFGDDRLVLLELGIGYIDLRIKSHGSSLCLPRMRQSNTY